MLGQLVRQHAAGGRRLSAPDAGHQRKERRHLPLGENWQQCGAARQRLAGAGWLVSGCPNSGLHPCGSVRETGQPSVTTGGPTRWHGKANMPQSAQNIRESCRAQARLTSFSVLLRRAVQASKLPGVALTLSNSVCQAATAGSTSGAAATAHTIALRRAGMGHPHIAWLPGEMELTAVFELRSEDLASRLCSRKALPVSSSAPSSAGGWSAAVAAAGTPASARSAASAMA